jgi:sugar lactone lactonase YvrE
VFDSEGEFQFCFGSNGEGNGQFNAPTGVAVDNQDNIIVADWGNSRIQIFDSTGSFLAFVNTLACPLYGPQGVAMTTDGHVVVADSGNHCYKMYRCASMKCNWKQIPNLILKQTFRSRRRIRKRRSGVTIKARPKSVA